MLSDGDDVRVKTSNGHEFEAGVGFNEAILDRNPKHYRVIEVRLHVNKETADRLGLPRDYCIHVFASRSRTGWPEPEAKYFAGRNDGIDEYESLGEVVEVERID